ncbi:DUF1622 domain-containing protein [Enterococcus durans]|uniref:DUF1622 domain-containing protein n=1 Tax=Enterococcus durans TaxID=53345 RepID=A0A5N0YR10_9ENTE|nr:MULTISPECIES: DUF1622 domain-containing protein [Enterococcus]KAA9177749.1 DUF1622 domain-containing protein [Enterococcus durans]KAA9183453.1 DUF1622 domain-containing protein [Enterococcus durans]KAA9184684.1 DUF1622 domain-containing protein [Enterococcus durans]KAA9189442.1 DUF1622 domain-containing protein [Enterococcus durans]KAA9191729.1 DUF1622 domain-containing protein [Enterococcus durans]
MLDSTLMVCLDWLMMILNLASIIILVVGVFLVLKTLFDWRTLKKDYGQRNSRNAEIRKLLASYILLSLEVLVVADIIESVIKPTWTDILKLALIILIRTIISYFLNLEIEEQQRAKAGMKDES